MFWDLSLDDYNGAFCNKVLNYFIKIIQKFLFKGRFYLINSVKNEFLSKKKIKILKPMTNKNYIWNRDQCWKGDGFYTDFKSNCQNYYRCYNSHSVYKRIEYFTCPKSTLYDEKLKTCTFKNSFICKK